MSTIIDIKMKKSRKVFYFLFNPVSIQSGFYSMLITWGGYLELRGGGVILGCCYISILWLNCRIKGG